MNSLNGLSNYSIVSNLSGISSGTFDNITSNDITSNNTYQGETNKDKILYLKNVSSDIQQQIDNINSSGYVTNSSLTNTLLNYVLQTSLNTQLNNYVLNSTYTTAINTLNTKTTNISYNSTLGTTFLSSTYTVMSFGQTTSHMRIDGSLVVNAGALFIPNSTLVNIQYLSGTTSNINTSITNLNTKTTNMTFVLSQTNFSGTVNFSSLNFSSFINGFAKADFDNCIQNCKSLTSSAQTQITNLNTNLTNNYLLISTFNTTIGNYVLITDLNNTLLSYVTNTSLSNTLSNYALTSSLSNYCTMSLYNSLKTQVDNLQAQADVSTAWITANGVALLALIATVATHTGQIGTIQGQIIGINATNDNQDSRLSTLEGKVPAISYSVATGTTTVSGSQLTCPALSSTSITNSGSLSTDTITSGNITSSGTISGDTVNTNSINMKFGNTLNIGNTATTINMGSSTLGNTIYIGNVLSNVVITGSLSYSSGNNPFNMVGGFFQQF